MGGASGCERCDRVEDVDYDALQHLRAVIKAEVWHRLEQYVSGCWLAMHSPTWTS